MKKVCETPFNSWDETAESILIYALEEDEYFDLFEEYGETELGYIKDADRLLGDLGLYSEWGAIMPGAFFTRFYLLDVTPYHLIISRKDALNV